MRLPPGRILRISDVYVPGIYPYRGDPKLWNVDFIAVSDECLQCGTCADKCPVGAVDAENSRLIDTEKCITCCACIKNCSRRKRVKNLDIYFLTSACYLYFNNFSDNKLNMLVLAVDVGTGTQDILLYNSEKEIENSLIMVMPAPTQVVVEKVRKATRERKTIVLSGNIMGGGPSTFAIRAHLEAGLPVYATEQAALTIHDNIEKVKAFGILIVSEEEAKKLANEENALNIVMQDFDPKAVSSVFSIFEVPMPENYAVAVQDHGDAPGKSNRIYRFELFKELIDRGGKLENFVYRPEEIPKPFTRMKAQADSLFKAVGNRKIRSVFMDTGPAAIFGALMDPSAVQPSIVVNIGNGHTLGALVLENHITALFEHHSSLMNPEKLQDYIIRLADGKLDFDEVFTDGGHGVYIKEAPGFEQVRSIMVTGPKREMLEKLSDTEIREEILKKLNFAAPFGSMMLSGCFGLLAGFFKKYPEPSIKFINN